MASLVEGLSILFTPLQLQDTFSAYLFIISPHARPHRKDMHFRWARRSPTQLGLPADQYVALFG